uniref:Uncharacterized protein n=2 Tax=Anguilla anguilla TaxID=7936 RepID=A0A0E9SYA9_ANGAN
MSCITLSSFKFNRGCVSWILMLHIGQYLLVWRYFTIQLLQNVCKHSVMVVASMKYPAHR